MLPIQLISIIFRILCQLHQIPSQMTPIPLPSLNHNKHDIWRTDNNNNNKVWQHHATAKITRKSLHPCVRVVCVCAVSIFKFLINRTAIRVDCIGGLGQHWVILIDTTHTLGTHECDLVRWEDLFDLSILLKTTFYCNVRLNWPYSEDTTDTEFHVITVHFNRAFVWV